MMGADSDGSGGEDEREGDPPLPESVVEEAERLTRLAREAVDESEAATYRTERDGLLEDHDYEARVREDDAGETLVCYPAEWLQDGVIQVDEVEDLSRGVEVSLSGPGESDEWDAVDAHNRDVAETVAERHGEPHASTVSALADFASNHYAKALEDLTTGEQAEFREEYLPRNGWPSEEQLAQVEESLELAVAVAEDGDTDDPKREAVE